MSITLRKRLHDEHILGLEIMDRVWPVKTCTDCVFERCVFIGLQLRSLFRPPTFNNCRFIDCDFSAIRATKAVFSNCEFVHLKLNRDYAFFDSCVLVGCRFQDCNLANVDFTNTQLSDIEFLDCYLRRVHYSVCQLSSVSYYGQLVGCNFTHCKVTEVNLLHAELTDCLFSEDCIVKFDLPSNPINFLVFPPLWDVAREALSTKLDPEDSMAFHRLVAFYRTGGPQVVDADMFDGISYRGVQACMRILFLLSENQKKA